MSTTLMQHNGKGWEKRAKRASVNTGHEPAFVAVECGAEGILVFDVGESHDAHTRAEKTSINAGFNRAGWVGHTMHDARECPTTGAWVSIDRNFWEDGEKIVARYTRAS